MPVLSSEGVYCNADLQGNDGRWWMMIGVGVYGFCNNDISGMSNVDPLYINDRRW